MRVSQESSKKHQPHPKLQLTKSKHANFGAGQSSCQQFPNPKLHSVPESPVLLVETSTMGLLFLEKTHAGYSIFEGKPDLEVQARNFWSSLVQ